MENWENIIFLLLLSIGIVMTLVVVYQFFIIKDLQNNLIYYANTCDMEDMKDIEYDRDYEVTGIYKGMGYFTVKAKGQDWADVMETCSHEYLHYKWGDGHFER